MTDADVIVVGAGLAGLAATRELALAGHRVILVDQESEQTLGGQARWSLGGLFLVGTPEQRLAGVRDGHDLALADWLASAGFDEQGQDRWPRRWAEAYVDFASGEKRRHLRSLGVRLALPVMWPERGSGSARGPGNSVPRFHLTWGSGPGIVAAFAGPVLEAAAEGRVSLRFHHRVDGLVTQGGSVTGVRGRLLAPDAATSSAPNSRDTVGDFELRAGCVLAAAGGMGGSEELIHKHWPTERLGPAPEELLIGVPPHVDGRMLSIVAAAGGSVIHLNRMWHYPDGVGHAEPAWPRHGVRVLAGPSPLWLDATGRRLPAPFFPGHDSLGPLGHVIGAGHAHSWLVLTRSMAERELTLSGSDQNTALAERDLRAYLTGLTARVPTSVQTLIRHREDLVVHSTLRGLVDGMNALTPASPLDYARVKREVRARDEQMSRAYSKDFQSMAVRNARAYWPDRLFKVASPHALLDRRHGPLLAVRLRPLTRKTLGGLETDLSARVLRCDGSALDGLFAAGEAAGFGGGGMHGHRALEGTFLGGCVFSGLTAGRAIASALG
ncbi:FAD-binding dehydrogenase [Streptomyces buecherae]|uniref:FAD-binding dehydrogenase n=1 Tax=Streptomyces buecherae TaxID=2763006 RepID=A0A7H8N602_9ACTN|nr:FAD-binding dehydrogenase [Streptomyces buecherae]QKW49925.1 FAD-binding dehydrogenase [Streptomyces buecherae]